MIDQRSWKKWKRRLRNIIELITGGKKHPLVTPYCPEGKRIYCIGDIHGRVDLLQQLHSAIEKDVANYTGGKTIIYLGDFIDRGENSKAVIDVLLNQPLVGFDAIYLRGNHEQTMLDFLHQAEIGQAWLTHGGMAALVSYGVKVAKLPARIEDYIALQSELATRLPKDHLAFLKNTRLSYKAGSYYFVHAGIRPGVALDQQISDDQLWVRDEFLSYHKNHERIIVYGHSINDEPEIHAHRIGIDTGAYISGKLTALVLEQDTQRFIQTHA